MLNEAERRGALVVVALLLLGAGYDLWRARGGTPPVEPPPPASAETVRQADEPAPGPVERGTTRLDLNRASAAELDRLPGIGPTLARRIVDHRRAHGAFREVGELLAVRGIGPRLLARIEPRIAVSGSPGGLGSPSDTVPGGDPQRP